MIFNMPAKPMIIKFCFVDWYQQPWWQYRSLRGDFRWLQSPSRDVRMGSEDGRRRSGIRRWWGSKSCRSTWRNSGNPRAVERFRFGCVRRRIGEARYVFSSLIIRSMYSNFFVSISGFGNKSITLYDIRAELNCRYKDLRTPYRSANPEELFDMLTKETPETFYIGKLVQATVIGIARRKPQGRTWF